MRLIDLDDYSHTFCGHDGEYEKWNIDPDVTVPIKSETKKGRWIEHNPHKWGLGIKFECSECGYEMDCEEPNYCPNCGADMREGEQE